jgi:adenylate cyclase
VRQRDTYFVSEHGRLKLRETDGGAEVISYERTEDDGARWSHYRREPVPDAAATRARLAAERGVRGVVEKTRAVWHTGRSRVHLDYVNGLGDFLEIEVVQPEPPESGPVELAALLAALGLDRTAGIAGSYIDLLEAGM